MSRVKRGVNAHKKRERLLKYTKGFRWGRKSKERAAKEALLHAWTHAFQGRKNKKRVFRKLWNVKIDRKILADLAENEPAVFKKIVEFVK